MSCDVRMSVIDGHRRLGSVCAIHASRVMVNLADASARPQTTLYGSPRGSGQVGEYVLVEVDHRVVLGRVSAVRLLERERLAVNPSFGEPVPVDPIAEVDLLATLDPVSSELAPGIEISPRLGSAVYSPAPSLLSELVSKQRGAQPETKIDLGTAMAMPDARVMVSPERLFGRHCAILGATGGGKSYTIATLLEQISSCSGKAILIDATGEFYTLRDLAEHVSLGPPAHGESETYLPLSTLDEQDLYALFQPSGKVQGPKLREAIYSLRLAHLLENATDPSLIQKKNEFARRGLLSDGLIFKEGQDREALETLVSEYRGELENPSAPFNVRLLAAQVSRECVWPTSRANPRQFGLCDDAALGYCSPLIARIQMVTRGNELKVFFSTTGEDLIERVEHFLNSSRSLLRISLASIPYSFNAREIVSNALGRWLLRRAREGLFKKTRPTVIFLDEAHNFLNRKIGDEESAIKLDAFDQIAKEGRKHWLTIALATQRPRDLPEGVLSQMGTLVVHRLTNHRDREVVERACGDIDRTSVELLPTFAPGNAAIVGVDFPFPLTVLIDRPLREPDSLGPQYQAHWIEASTAGAPSSAQAELGAPIGGVLTPPVPRRVDASTGVQAYVAPLDPRNAEDDLPF